MTMRSLLVMLSVAMFAVSAVAQSCPKEKTKDVPASVTYGPLQNCGGFTYQMPGVSISTIPNGCPLHLIYTPPHQVAEPSTAETLVVSNGVSPITMVTFLCATRWIVFIPIGSACRLDQTTNIGFVPMLTTAPCPKEQV